MYRPPYRSLVPPPVPPPPLQYKDRINLDHIKPAVDWRKAGVADFAQSP